MIINHKRCHKKSRAQAYPPIGDQLDAVYKLAVVLKEQGVDLPEETLEWIADCSEVKKTYPKV